MSAFTDKLLKLAGTVGNALSGNVIPTAVEIGKDVVELIDEAIPVVTSKADQATLQQTRDDLQEKVLSHADRTEAELRG